LFGSCVYFYSPQQRKEKQRVKTSHTAIVKAVVDVMRSNAENKLVIQRVANSPSGKRYVQIMTALGVVTIQDKGSLTELDYPIQDIGAPANWSKVSKGVVVSKETTEVPFTTAANAARLGDYEIAAAEHLLSVETGLAPINVLTHPGIQIAYADAPGSAVWTYDPSASVLLTNHSAQWTRNAENCVGIYALIKPWIKAVLYSVPKDPETGYPQKLSGISLGSVGSRVGVHIVSHELSMVIACTAAMCPKDTPSSYILDGKLKSFMLTPDSTFIKQEDIEVKANLIDLSALQQTSQKPIPKEAAPAPVQEATVTAPAATAPVEVKEAATVAPAPSAESEPVQPMVYEKPELQAPEVVPAAATAEPIDDEPAEITSDNQLPAEPVLVKSTDEQLSELIFKLEEQVKIVRALVTDAKTFRKQYKAESKDSKANAKLTADNAKLKEEIAALKARCATQEATLNKFKALLNG
jgi:hypothetical protein